MMAETMVRTQIYLPRDIYEALKERANAEGIPMGQQIREALGVYITRQQEEEPIRGIPEDDPIWSMIGMAEGGPPDGAENHDKYIYRRDWGPDEEEAL